MLTPTQRPSNQPSKIKAVEDMTKNNILLHISQKIPAGFPSPAADYTTEPLDLNRYLIEHTTSSYIFTVEGDSMRNAGILPDDKVIVDRAIEARHDHIVIAVVNNEFTIKRLFKKNNKIALLPDNPAYSPITFKEHEELHIWGVVVGVIRKL